MKNKIIIARPWNLKYFNDLSNYIDKPNIVLESFFENKLGDQNTSFVETYDLFSDEILFDIIRNCRVLRRFSFNKSIDLISYTINSFYKFKMNEYDYIISLTVDNYILDVICRLCQMENNQFIGLVNSPIPGYVRHTKYGELNQGFNGPKNDYLKSFYFHKKRPSHYFLLKGKNKIKSIVKDFMRYSLYNLKSLFGDKSYHTFANIFFYKGKKRVYKYKELTNPTENYIFIPLQFTPECTIDYWSPIKPNNSYESFILNIFKL